MLTLSNSSIRTFKTCKRRYYLGHVRKLGTPRSRHNPTTVAELGTRCHTALEAHYGYGVDAVEAFRIIYDAAREAFPGRAEDLAAEQQWAVAMVTGYLEWAAERGIDEAFEVIDTERAVTAGMDIPGGSVTLMGKLDQTVRRTYDGALMFRDFKTVGSFSKADDLVRDEQFRFYSMLLALLGNPDGERIAGGLYTMLLRSKRTARSKGPYYQQIAVSYNRHDLNSMWLRTRETATEITQFTERLENGENHLSVAYPNPSQTCAWSCPFVSVCHLADDGSRFEDALAGLFEPKDPFAYYGTQDIDLIKKTVGIEEEPSEH